MKWPDRKCPTCKSEQYLSIYKYRISKYRCHKCHISFIPNRPIRMKEQEFILKKIKLTK